VHYRLAYRALWVLERVELGTHARRAKTLYDGLLAKLPTDISRMTQAALAALLVGDADLWDGRLDAARTSLQRSIDLLLRVHGSDQQDFSNRSQAAVAYMVLSEVEAVAVRPREAERAASAGLALLEAYPPAMRAHPAVRTVAAGLFVHRAADRKLPAGCADYVRADRSYTELASLRTGEAWPPYLQKLVDESRVGATHCP
jgi:hypothetical protein